MFERCWTSTAEDPLQRLPRTIGLKSNECDPFLGPPLEYFPTEYGSDFAASPPLGASRPNHETSLVGQPEPTEESDQSSASSSFDEWLQPYLDSTVDVDLAQNYGFDYSNHPSLPHLDPPLLVQGTSATTPGSSTGTSNGSIISNTVGSFHSSSFPFTSGSSSSTNLSPGTTPRFTEPPGAPPSLKGAPQALQPKRFLECLDCQRKSSCSARLRNHQCNTKKFFCDFVDCTGGFTQEKDLKRHQQTVHADKAFLRVCQVCQYKTPRKDHLERHERSHQNGRRKRARREE